ncbi:MAG: SUMF1/EgtB/PvdO family nonheme iron enzyme, partial [Spartobacteria bacterium]
MEKELTAILESEHLEHLAPKFAEQGVTDEILDQLEDSDLRELGVEKLGERKRLLGAFMQNRDIPLSGTVMITVGGGVMPSDSELSGLRVEEFEIGKFPVMQEEWEWVRVWALAKSYELETGYGTGSSHPVTHVSWYDAVKWCNAKSEHELLEPVYYMEGKVYRNGEFGPDGSRLITWHNKARGYR